MPEPIDILVTAVLDAFHAAHDRNAGDEVWSERATVARACEHLQLCSTPFVGVNEVPYSDGAARDSRVDLWVKQPQGSTALWLEFKPIYSGFLYWNYSKFSYGAASKTYIFNSSSPVLDDIDKMAKIPKPYEENRFAFLLALETANTDEIGDDERVPQPGSRLSPGQIVYLAKRRFDARAGECVDLRRVWEGNGRAIHLVLLHYRYTGDSPALSSPDAIGGP